MADLPLPYNVRFPNEPAYGVDFNMLLRPEANAPAMQPKTDYSGVGAGANALFGWVPGAASAAGQLLKNASMVPPAPKPTLPPGNGIVPNADVMGTYTPPKPAPQPISVVRGLQEMVYKPQEGGGYKAEMSDADRAAAVAAAAKVDKDRAEAIKAMRGTGMDEAIRAYMAPVPGLQALANSPAASAKDKADAQARMNEIFQTIFKTDALTRLLNPTVQNTGG